MRTSTGGAFAAVPLEGLWWAGDIEPYRIQATDAVLVGESQLGLDRQLVDGLTGEE